MSIILTTPGTTMQQSYLGRFGNTIEVNTPDGRGIVYDVNGNFLFFKELKMITTYRINISSPPDREKLVAEIFFGDFQWAEINQEHGQLEIEFYQRPDNQIWHIDFVNVISALNEAKYKLIGEIG